MPEVLRRSFFVRTIAAQLHFLGCIVAGVGLFVLLHYARLKIEPLHFWACLIFGSTSIFVFAVSTIYHFMSDGFTISPRLEQNMEDLDHFAIFLFIAGTYTPLILNAISPPWNQVLLWLIWGIGFAGIIYTHIRPKLPAWAQHRSVYTLVFVLMGWVLVIRLGEVFERLTALQGWLLVIGGLCYTIGAAIYALKRPILFVDVFGFHELWHVMVLLGYAFHYFMILNFYL